MHFCADEARMIFALLGEGWLGIQLIATWLRARIREVPGSCHHRQEEKCST